MGCHHARMSFLLLFGQKVNKINTHANANKRNQYLKALTILFTALLAGQVIFAVLAFTLVYTGSFKNSMPELENIFLLFVPALIIIARLAGNQLFKKKILDALNTSTTEEKLSIYRAAFITRCALLEFPILFAIITYLLINRMELLLFAAGGLLLFAMMKPTKEQIASELQINGNDLE